MCCCVHQRWNSKIPPSMHWVSSLSDGVATRAALRLLLVFLCVLITLLMAFLNIVSQHTNTSTHTAFCFNLAFSV